MGRSYSDSAGKGVCSNEWNTAMEANKIRMVMEVPFNDHPYLIGPNGKNTRVLMEKHDVLLHFPDINRMTQGPKINHILVFGTVEHVEKLRRELRERMPIRMCVNLKGVPNPQDKIAAVEQHAKETDKQVVVRASGDGTCCVFKTPFSNSNSLSVVAKKFFDDDTVDKKNPMYMIGTPILPLINCYNKEVSDRLLEFLDSKTLTRVLFPPDMSQITQAPFYFVQGYSVDSVMATFNFLLGLSMCQIMFIVPSDTDISEEQILVWRTEFLVDVKIEYYFDVLLKTPVKRANLRFFEFCCKYAFMVRCDILKMRRYVSNNDYLFMDEIKYLIPPTVFDDCQLFFPTSFCDTDFFKKATDKTKMEVFREFYGPIPTFGLNKSDSRLQVDCLFSQLPSSDTRLSSTYVTPEMCLELDKKYEQEMYWQHHERMLTQSYFAIPPPQPMATILLPPGYLPAIMSGVQPGYPVHQNADESLEPIVNQWREIMNTQIVRAKLDANDNQCSTGKQQQKQRKGSKSKKNSRKQQQSVASPTFADGQKKRGSTVNSSVGTSSSIVTPVRELFKAFTCDSGLRKKAIRRPVVSLDVHKLIIDIATLDDHVEPIKDLWNNYSNEANNNVRGKAAAKPAPVCTALFDDMENDVFEEPAEALVYTYDLPLDTTFVVINPSSLPPNFVNMMEVCVFRRIMYPSYGFMIPLEVYVFIHKQLPSRNRICRRTRAVYIPYQSPAVKRLAFAVHFLDADECAEAFEKFPCPISDVEIDERDLPKPRALNYRYHVPETMQEAATFINEVFMFPAETAFLSMNLSDGVPAYYRFNQLCDTKTDQSVKV